MKFVDDKAVVYLVKGFRKIKYDYVGLNRVVDIFRDFFGQFNELSLT